MNRICDKAASCAEKRVGLRIPYILCNFAGFCFVLYVWTNFYIVIRYLADGKSYHRQGEYERLGGEYDHRRENRRISFRACRSACFRDETAHYRRGFGDVRRGFPLYDHIGIYWKNREGRAVWRLVYPWRGGPIVGRQTAIVSATLGACHTGSGHTTNRGKYYCRYECIRC